MPNPQDLTRKSVKGFQIVRTTIRARDLAEAPNNFHQALA
jgi:hypothetical protein